MWRGRCIGAGHVVAEKPFGPGLVLAVGGLNTPARRPGVVALQGLKLSGEFSFLALELGELLVQIEIVQIQVIVNPEGVRIAFLAV